MPHVQQRFLVHRFVLEYRKRGFGPIEQRVAGLIQIRMSKRRNHAPIRLVGELTHVGTLRPVHGVSRLVIAFRRIDAAREERLEPFVDARLAEPAVDQRVEAECRQVPFVEDERVALGDRPLVIRLVGHEVENRA